MNKTADFKTWKDEIRGEREKNLLPKIFSSKKPLPFTLKRPAYSKNAVSNLDDQGPVSRDKKFLTAKKFA